jgi:hypothetical protein
LVQSSPIRNADVRWDQLDPCRYHDENYGKLREDDRQILRLMSHHFRSRSDPAPRKVYGVDVGTGSNLYPALAMLPFCDRITLIDHSPASVRWLSHETEAAHDDWDPFWRQLESDPLYAGVDPWPELRHKTTVVEGDVLRPLDGSWDIGTMMFVAESITGDMSEFRLAIKNFLGSLKPGAPFAMAFMAGSEGYTVADKWFPSVPVGSRDVTDAIGDVAKFEPIEIPIPDEGPLRDGYEGMILALGVKAAT